MRISERMIKQIQELRDSGHSIRKITEALKISRNTVRRYLRQEREDRQPQAEPGQEMAATPDPPPPTWRSVLPWDEIVNQRVSGVSAKALYEEYAPAISYSRFCRNLRSSIMPKISTALRLPHNAGEKTQLDFCDGLKIIDPKTGKESKTQFFCGVLPFSSRTYGEFLLSQKLEPFIRAQENMWGYFGGVSQYVVVDNLKSAVRKAHRYDPDINPTYVEYANHSGFAVLPARPYTPRDKAAVESAIGVIQRTFFQKYRNHKFYSLSELNQCFRDFLDNFNSQPMREFGVSRLQRFENERHHLNPVPARPYEIFEWRQAKVHPDSCIQVLKSIYSVPYRYVGQTVRVKVSSGIIEVFSDDMERIACHTKSQKPGTVIVDEHHLPPTRLQESSFEIRKARTKASSVGPRTKELIDGQLDGDRPLRHLRRVQGILRLLNQGIPPESLEYACAQALTFRRCRVSYIKDCAIHHKSNGGRLRLNVPTRDPNSIHLHGGINVRPDPINSP